MGLLLIWLALSYFVVPLLWKDVWLRGPSFDQHQAFAGRDFLRATLCIERLMRL